MSSLLPDSPTSSEALQPGCSTGESALIATDDDDEAAGASLGPFASLQSCISEIQGELEQQQIDRSNAAADDAKQTTSPPASGPHPAPTAAHQSNAPADAAPTLAELDAAAAAAVVASPDATDEDTLHPSPSDDELRRQSDHIFVLNTSGKPIYTLHGSEDKLATLFGVMQALCSVVADSGDDDQMQSIQAAGMRIVFVCKAPLILVAVSKGALSVQQMQAELYDVYNLILSMLTLSSMTKILEERKNFDLRRLLAGSERLIDNLVLHRTQRSDDRRQKISNKPFVFLTNSVRILPLSSAIRDSIASAIQAACAKIKNLVFAVMLAEGRLITLVRMKKYFLHPADLRLMFNLIECSENFKTAENWTPLCLPRFDANGFLYAHVSYLADDCQACLLLLSVERDVFFTLSEAKRKITERLRRTQCLKAINEAMLRTISLPAIGIPEMRHFLYKSKSTAQLLCSEIAAPYADERGDQFARLEALYYRLHHRIHSAARPAKLCYEAGEREVQLGWVTAGYELYATFEPLVSKAEVIALVNRLLFWIKKEEDGLFILNAPTF